MEVWRKYGKHAVSNTGIAIGPRKQAESVDPRGYIHFKGPNGKNCKVHRAVAELFVHNPRPDIFNQVDHIDRNTSNNHWRNLRWTNNRLNKLNSGKGCSQRTSGRWEARAWDGIKNRYLGTYTTPWEASKVSKSVQKEVFGNLYQELTGITVGWSPFYDR